ncbi:hypothetical protein QN372_18180 [Undibacterium sp. RTI2.1]|uniref:hypothetical protein n=1 Tax=unclassified Undibacterium TaxID=2630295 RepID=UPI002AB4C814|nr:MULTISPECIES: hypothetical protein [unclassified Undibacterium]MDY7540728.1 hypothetical protein [Undibacterium sp. 5I1]MEB0032680.1 hypothetical protein [Undibacterium sp. RTI2.1]MEB0118680.1 hypothetical protein [Undibacterium sp. RTI2.2]MEB0232650.1 hypothetical protein [Undibacterium sp. 10I3]MEB0259635.1 hypothetical protein [Undibacterium sp. 5I1]
MLNNKPVHFSEHEFYEANDAISETVRRMINKGQTKDEVQNASLASLWSAWKLLVASNFGKWETPGMLEVAPKVKRLF